MILDAAARIFSQKSYHDATLEEIAAEAELAKGTLYNYFHDKQDIFISLLERGHELYATTVSEVLSINTGLESLLREIFVRVTKVMFEHKYMIRMIMTAGVHLSELDCSKILAKWHENYNRAAVELAGVLGSFSETGGMSEGERLTAARLILGSLRLIFSDSLCSKEGQVSQEEIDNYVRLLYRAVNMEKNV